MFVDSGRARKYIAMLATMSLTACLGSSVEPPSARFNPYPKEHYEITLIVDDPTVTIERIDGRVQFYIKNRKCMPIYDSIAGLRPDENFDPEFPFEQEMDRHYVGYIYADWAVDEDYYGLGICNWGITSVQAVIKTGGVVQYARLPYEKLISGEPQLNLCLRSPLMAENVCSTSSEDIQSNEAKKAGHIIAIRSKKVRP